MNLENSQSVAKQKYKAEVTLRKFNRKGEEIEEAQYKINGSNLWKICEELYHDFLLDDPAACNRLDNWEAEQAKKIKQT
jgi:hypothetical protein